MKNPGRILTVRKWSLFICWTELEGEVDDGRRERGSLMEAVPRRTARGWLEMGSGSPGRKEKGRAAILSSSEEVCSSVIL